MLGIFGRMMFIMDLTRLQENTSQKQRHATQNALNCDSSRSRL
jgi:hypothetical protein